MSAHEGRAPAPPEDPAVRAIPALMCATDLRRSRIRAAGAGGLDYVEVGADGRELTVTFLGAAPESIDVANVRIDAADGPRGAVRAVAVRLDISDDADRDDRLRLSLDRPGYAATYTLRLVETDARGRPTDRPLAGFDPRYARLDFTFPGSCPSGLDCASADGCAPPSTAEPDISYLAKDYASFRQLILDRFDLIMPGWTERHLPDLGVTLVELLAYVGDHLSYHQDAVAGEAYLGTARRRISVRRHARLIDYRMHDGCNARTWVSIEVEAPLRLSAYTYFFLAGSSAGAARPRGDATTGPALALDDVRAELARATVFEPVLDVTVDLNPQHNCIRLWTWGDTECCLPRGATRATLRDDWLDGERDGERDERPRALALHPGDVLIFEEVLGPRTGVAADADPTHRQAVRLTSVTPGVDALYGSAGLGQPIVEVGWDAADALTFDLCVSCVAGPACERVEPVSVVRGNVILVDHGRTMSRSGQRPRELCVPAVASRPAGCAGVGEPAPRLRPPGRPDLTLPDSPVTQRVLFPDPTRIATAQAARLERIPDELADRLRELWTSAYGGLVPDAAALDELRIVFGRAELVRLGLVPPRPGVRHPLTAAQAASALARLLARHRWLLRGTLRWLADLTHRTRAGLALGRDGVEEVRDVLGARFATELVGDDPARYGPATAALTQDPRAALPVLDLRAPGAGVSQAGAGKDGAGKDGAGWSDGVRWAVRPDLLASGPTDSHVVGEVDDDGVVHLRFGDGVYGRGVEPGRTLLADYRVGNGVAGNVGADAINWIVFRGPIPGGITGVRNPLAAAGGIDPELVREVKLRAPGAIRSRLERAVTPEDYATLATAVPGVQRAVAVRRWNGSWYEIHLAVDPLGAADPEPALLRRVRAGAERHRRIGHDVVVTPTRYVPLLVKLVICVRPEVIRGHVRAALLAALGSRGLPVGGQPSTGSGLFQPDNLTFGEPVRLSRIVAAAAAVPGVTSVEVARFERLYASDQGERDAGVLRIGPDEVARLDNDPARPGNGRLELDLRGGR
ncbi:putative baseplate assembly protein [Frankia sp. Cr1]|uniref:putative baseplate assembly protein n=1 Tax=Frankia sp. Cr1 TaxID=3073931 RepID=UPI002AD220FD|nr:putative baseplate assembly protein [Frankia sp. Cr1]